MTASPPKVNGHTRPPALQVLGDWQPIGATPTEPAPAETPAPSQTSAPQPESDLVAQAQAEAIRAKAWAESEERRLAAEAEKEAALKRAEAEADAIRVKAEEDARKLRLANDRAERKAIEEAAASEARIAEHNRRRDDADRAREDAARLAAEQQAAVSAEAAEVAEAEDRWRGYARSFYIVCAIVALPVQVAAFYNPKALWLMAAPLMLEGGAWVVLKGAAAAVASHRPHWHYRLIAWLLAFLAAGINLWHGLAAFDPATAIGTAFASIAGPGVWDLHEHGRIRKRDGVPTRRERKAAEKEAERIAAEKVAEEKRRAAEKEAAEKAAEEEARLLAERRAGFFPKVWEHAEKLAADLGETTVTEAIWERAKLDVEGAKPGESAEALRMRNAAQARVEAARQNRPVNTLSKTTNAQRAAQMPPGPNRVLKTRATRRPGDTPKYVGVARKQAAITAKNAASNAR
ncbi:hypothetical protein GCM10010293_40430 [Streptomyces griseoflavus]|uniref:hypothetical protein n=1 Tax=Streptomyces griseoflavus TaxID=35619 RepID=UPI00167C5416|nr:hypothetical protein [Streptomyces griseoflavus]GGV36888.1 hypothetical protein GCM10010293_40430 [Streptomyces griseoflavus]